MSPTIEHGTRMAAACGTTLGDLLGGGEVGSAERALVEALRRFVVEASAGR